MSMHITVSLMALLVLLACGRQVGSAPIPDCKFVESQLKSKDERGSAGYSAADILSFSEREFILDLQWSEQNAVDVPLADDAKPLQIAVMYQGGAIVDHGSSPQGCNPDLQVQVGLRISSTDGMFAESRIANLFSSSRENAQIMFEIPADELQGSLRLVPKAEGWIIRAIILSLDMSPAGASGEVLALSQRNEGGASPEQVDHDLRGGEFTIATLK